ncbi:hypothetical protein HDV05_002301, partial [Chytridiales sp. JEL 0842]
GALEMQHIRYRGEVGIGWSKDKTERCAFLQLHKEDAQQIKGFQGVYINGHNVYLVKQNIKVADRIADEKAKSLVLYGLPSNMEGRQFEELRAALGASYVRVPAYRHPGTGKLCGGTEIHLIFEAVDAVRKIEERVVTINNRRYHLRALLKRDGSRNVCCYACGSNAHICRDCPKKKERLALKSQKANAKMEAYFENKMSDKQMKAFSMEVTTSVAKGKPIIPVNYASYSLAVKRGAMIDPETAKLAENRGTQNAILKHKNLYRWANTESVELAESNAEAEVSASNEKDVTNANEDNAKEAVPADNNKAVSKGNDNGAIFKSLSKLQNY